MRYLPASSGKNAIDAVSSPFRSCFWPTPSRPAPMLMPFWSAPGSFSATMIPVDRSSSGALNINVLNVG